MHSLFRSRFCPVEGDITVFAIWPSTTVDGKEEKAEREETETEKEGQAAASEKSLCLTGSCWAGPCCTRFRCLDVSPVVRRYITSAIRRIASLCEILSNSSYFYFYFLHFVAVPPHFLF